MSANDLYASVQGQAAAADPNYSPNSPNAKKGGTQTVTQRVDPKTQAYVEELRRRALAGADNPIFGQARNLGNLGFGALSGDQSAIGTLMQQNNPLFDRIRQQSLMGIGDQASLQGAFGGSRQGVAEGTALGRIGEAQAQDVNQRAFQYANLGLGVDPAVMAMLTGSTGPYGTTQSTPTQSDPFSQLLGLGLTAASFIPGPQQPFALAAGGATQFGNAYNPNATGYRR